MTDEERQEMEKRLYSSNDAAVWAEAFCELFDGYRIGVEGVEYLDRDRVDQGTMIGWFANAMETAAFFERQKRPYVSHDTGWSEHAS